jgi:hypothetical protein
MVDLQPLIQAVILALATLVTGFATASSPMLWAYIRSKVKFEDAKVDEAAQKALAGGQKLWDTYLLKSIAFAETKLNKAASKAGNDPKFLEVAKEYLNESWPDAVKETGKNDTELVNNLMRAMPSETSVRVDAAVNEVPAAAVVVETKAAAKK